MRGRALGSERRERPRGHGDMQTEVVREAVPAHGPSPVVEHQVAVADRRPHLPRLAEDGSRLFPQRQFVFAPSLAQDAGAPDVGVRQAVERKRGQFRHAQPRGVAEMQHGAVAQT